MIYLYDIKIMFINRADNGGRTRSLLITNQLHNQSCSIGNKGDSRCVSDLHLSLIVCTQQRSYHLTLYGLRKPNNGNFIPDHTRCHYPHYWVRSLHGAVTVSCVLTLSDWRTRTANTDFPVFSGVLP